MYLNDLKENVAHLGFESYIEDADLFIASANRALSLIYIDRPVSKTAPIILSGPKVTLAREFIEHPSGVDVTIPFEGKALSFQSTGTGTCIITDNTGSNTVPLSIKNQLTKQFIRGKGQITLSGNFYFTICNFAVFDDVLSNSSSDIPMYTPYRELNPKDWCKDFRSFCAPPCDKYGNPIDSIKLADGRIITPYNYRGEIFLTYYRTPTLISSEASNVVIDVSGECEPLLTILTAAFMWLDDDAAKAQYYMSLYRDLVANIKRYSTNKINAEYSVNGWA